MVRPSAWVICGWLALSTSVMAQGLFDSVRSIADSDDFKEYMVTEKNGPIVIRVASFVGPTGKNQAMELVRELRQNHQITAYLWQLKVEIDEKPPSEEWIKAYTELYKVKPRVPKLQTPPPDNWVVLAGDFPSFESKDAVKMLKKIRGIDPKSIPAETRKMMRFAKKENETPNPLGGAMLVQNPNLPEKLKMKGDLSNDAKRLLLTLNDNDPWSIYRLKKPFTISVAQFGGMSMTDEKEFDEQMKQRKKQGGRDGMQLAGENAVKLAEQLRKTGYEAYTFHGQFASLVCIGGYSSNTDVRLMTDLQKFSEMKIGDFKLRPRMIQTPQRPTMGN